MGWSQFCMNGIWSCEKGVMCEWGGSHVKRMVTCEPWCGCVNWLVMFEWGVVICEWGVVV